MAERIDMPDLGQQEQRQDDGLAAPIRLDKESLHEVLSKMAHVMLDDWERAAARTLAIKALEGLKAAGWTKEQVLASSDEVNDFLNEILAEFLPGFSEAVVNAIGQSLDVADQYVRAMMEHHAQGFASRVRERAAEVLLAKAIGGFGNGDAQAG